MKRYRPTVITACIGLCAGFAICYLCLVVPHRGDKARASVPHQQKTTVTITRDGGVYLAGEQLDVSQLTLHLKALGGKQPVIIRADNTADFRRVVEVVDACKAAAVSQISTAPVALP